MGGGELDQSYQECERSGLTYAAESVDADLGVVPGGRDAAVADRDD